MALTQQDVQAEVSAYQPPDPNATPHPMAGPATAPPDPIQAAMTPPPAGKPTPSFLDSVISTVDKYSSKLGQAVMNYPTVRLVRQGQAGFVKGVVNMVDSAASAAKASGAGLAAAEDPAHAEEALNGPDVFHPAYDNARKVAMDFRDAIAVKDPSIPEHLAEGAGQLMPSFLMFSRVLGSIGTAAELTGGAKKAVDLARFATADAATNATAIAPHDPRLADTFALHKDAEGKYVDLLNKVSPDGSLFHQYINYIGDHTNETEAEGRWKNVLDGWNTAAALGGVLHVGGGILKQGWNALHYMADQGMGSLSDLMPANQEGKIGYHGTPNAPFEAFSNDAIGTGQGAQSYGYGHYIAENAATGETYQKSLSGRMNTSAALSDAQSAIKTAGGDKVKAVKNLTDMLANETDTALRQRMQNSVRLIKSGNADAGKGSLLKVEIDDKHIDNMLDLDKPMSKQPEILNKIPMKDQQKLQQVLEDHGQDLELNELTGNEFRQLIERSHNEGYLQPSTRSLYGTAVNPAGDASSYLSGRGIPGNKYFDSKSRVTGEGTRNYVVFDGKHIKVLGQEK